MASRHGEAAQPGVCASATRLRPANASSGPRSSSRPSKCSTSHPRHPGGRENFQPNCTCVLPSGRLTRVRCSWLTIPNGTETSTSRLCRWTATDITVVTACQRLPKARDEKCNCCPACRGSVRQKDPLRPLSSAERRALEQLAHSTTHRRCRGKSTCTARCERRLFVYRSRAVGWTGRGRFDRASGSHASTTWDSRRWNASLAVDPSQYGPEERERILAEFRRSPDRERDGTATLVIEYLAARAAASTGWPAQGEHVHHLAGAARCWYLLAAGPHLVPDRRRHPQAQAWRGQSPRSGRQREKG
jgi:hypothetical protein